MANLSLQGQGAIITGTVALDPASVAAQTCTEHQVTISGAAVGDVVCLTPPASLEAGLCVSGARVSAANTVQIRLCNVTGGAVDGSSRTWSYVLIRA
jgi:hypothetical protein